MSRAEREIRQVVASVHRSISLAHIELPEEFYPAHLSIALVDAVLRPRLEEETVALLERYCLRFGVARLRTEQWETPPIDAQEPLGALVRHHEELGTEAILRDVYRASVPAHAALSGDAVTVLDAARELRSIGVEVLQDVAEHVSDEIEYALRAGAGMDEASVRRLLMYTADEDFVRGDLPVRKFVAHALGVDVVSVSRTKGLVRAAAHELILAPRFLDCEIWRYGASKDGAAVLRGRG